MTLTISQMPSHSHPVMASGPVPADPVALGPGGNVWASTQTFLYNSSGASLTAMSSAALAPAGGNQPHSNISPYLTLNYIIALQGIFPSRD